MLPARSVLPCVVVLATLAAPVVQAQTAPPRPSPFELRHGDAPDAARVISTMLREELGAANRPPMYLDPLLAQLRCPQIPDTACTRRVAETVNAEDFVWGQVYRAGPGMIGVELHLSSKRQPERVLTVVWPETLTAEALRARVRQAVADLTWQRGMGDVRVFAGTVNGEVFADGASVGKILEGDARVRLPAGTHRIEVRASGFRITPQTVTVKPNGTAEVTLAAEQIDGPRTQGSDGAYWRKGVGYGAIFLGAGFLGLGYYSTRQVSEVNDDPGFVKYRASVTGQGDVCDVAASGQESKIAGSATPGEVTDMCDRASTYEVMQFVFYGLGLVSAGTGIYLLATDPGDGQKSKSTGLTVMPRSFGRSSAGIGASFAF